MLGMNNDSLPTLELIRSTSQVLLSVSPPAVSASRDRSADVASSRSAIFMVPITMPASSNIALAIGQFLPTQKWLRTTHAPVWEDSGRRQILQAVKVAQEKGLPDTADSTFFDWIEAETLRLETVRKSKAASDEGECGVLPNVSKKPYHTHKTKVVL
jgi:hypothetical protein